ncbi:hypothetical protein PMIN01_01098 [Paraphaeosphaeria minitans]|uniref:Uncharacterized protein n=1 Tax=Paraphaeosphaeria minitans TaxID=565426 RepID=A0A9P6GWN7_9PLEO|nr:hypothetical protein PMIN01_01098 [Paraphaeosphaeria minitans]
MTLCGRMGARIREHKSEMTYRMEYHQDKILSWSKPKKPRRCRSIQRNAVGLRLDTNRRRFHRKLSL